MIELTKSIPSLNRPLVGQVPPIPGTGQGVYILTTLFNKPAGYLHTHGTGQGTKTATLALKSINHDYYQKNGTG